MTIRAFYDRWPQYNSRLIETISSLTDEQLALRPSPENWPIWALVGHTAGTRVYWLCHIAGEPGAETTPFTDPSGEQGWEDDLTHPRSSAELVGALETTFAIIEDVLDRWTPEDLATTVERSYLDVHQVHSRVSIIQRMLTHDAYHAAEISVALGAHDIEPVYIWRAYDPLHS